MTIKQLRKLIKEEIKSNQLLENESSVTTKNKLQKLMEIDKDIIGFDMYFQQVSSISEEDAEYILEIGEHLEEIGKTLQKAVHKQL